MTSPERQEPPTSGPRYIGMCSVCILRVYVDAAGNEVRKQGGGRPPGTPHHHKKPYTVRKPERDDTDDHGWRGWMDVADRMGAL